MTPQGPSLDKYLSEVRVQQDRFLQAQGSLAVLDGLNGSPDAEWPVAAAKLRAARDTYTDIAIELRLIQPPRELATEHAGLTKSVELFAAAWDDLQQSLAQSDQQGVIRASQTSADQRIVEMRSAWRNGVVANARATNANVPSWVLQIGTRY